MCEAVAKSGLPYNTTIIPCKCLKTAAGCCCEPPLPLLLLPQSLSWDKYRHTWVLLCMENSNYSCTGYKALLIPLSFYTRCWHKAAPRGSKSTPVTSADSKEWCPFLPLLLSASLLLIWVTGEDFVSFCEDGRGFWWFFIRKDKDRVVLVHTEVQMYLVSAVCLACPLHDLLQTLIERKKWMRHRKISQSPDLICQYWGKIKWVLPRNIKKISLFNLVIKEWVWLCGLD